MIQIIRVVRYPSNKSLTFLMISSILTIFLGLLMLFYPDGTMSLMKTGFQILKIILSAVVVYYAISGALPYFKAQSQIKGGAYLVGGIILTILIWTLPSDLIYYVVAIFLILVGGTELVGAFMVEEGRIFLFLLGVIDLIVGILIFQYHQVLALLIAWYILFWGISRLLLSVELRKAIKDLPKPPVQSE